LNYFAHSYPAVRRKKRGFGWAGEAFSFFEAGIFIFDSSPTPE
jgi:hypothetical protein